MASSIKHAVGAYLSGTLSRREFLSRMTAAGWSLAAASSYSRLVSAAGNVAEPAGISSRRFEGRGGDIVVEQLRSCGVRFLFASPSTGSAPILDALIEQEDLPVILGLQEGVLTSMADGYSKASGRIPFVLLGRAGLANASAALYNAFRDRSPLILAVDQLEEAARGRGERFDVDDLLQCAEPFTRWRWESRRADQLAEDLRRAFKFAATPPTGPVFLSIPEDFLAARNLRTEIIEQGSFDPALAIRPAAEEVETLADRLLAARSPLLHVGPEIHRCGAEAAVCELAELLSIPVAQESFGWSNAFPTDHPLYLGYYQRGMRHPRDVDFVLNLGGRSVALPEGAALAHVSLDVDTLGRVNPAMLASAANVRLFAEDLVAALRSRLTQQRIDGLKASRGEPTATFTRKLAQARLQIARQRWSESPISHERLSIELQQALDPRTCIVQILDSGRIALNYLTFGANAMENYSSNGLSLGWSLGAALGVKLAHPDRPVLALMGDGDFLFGGCQALWTAQRYDIPITVIVLNNLSYDNERNRVWSGDSRQARLNRDMTGYIGSPDVEYVRFAEAYGVDGERIADPDTLGAALRRAVAANREGRSYLLDVLVSRRGVGADSTWHPAYSLSAERQTKL